MPTGRRLIGHLVLGAVLSLPGCTSFMMEVGKITSRMMTQKTSDLGDVAAQASLLYNLYPPVTAEAGYMSGRWKAGMNSAYVQFMKKRGMGMYEIEGTVTVDGSPLEYVGSGCYYREIDYKPGRTYTFKVRTEKGQEAEFRVKALPPIELISPEKGQVLDITKDIVIELEGEGLGPGNEIRVSMLGSQMGIRTFIDIGCLLYTSPSPRD